MTDDLVARMRSSDFCSCEVIYRAADRIEELEVALRKINARLNDTDSWLAQSIDAREIADAALEGKE